MTPDRATLARALMLLRECATNTNGDLVVTDPWSKLVSAEIDRDAVAALMTQKCLVGIGQMRFRIVRETLPEPKLLPTPPPVVAAPRTTASQPTFLLIVDAENAVRTHEDAGVPFDPAMIRERAAGVGAIAFSFALGNYEALTRSVRDALALAGFTILHCQRLRDGNGGKDTVDEHIQDLVQRFLALDVLNGVILVSDDRNFAPLLNGVRDRGLRSVRLTLRNGSSLDTIGEVHLLPTPGTPTPPQGTAATRRWMPDLIIEDLRMLSTLPAPEHTVVLQRIRTRAPFVQHFLRIMLRKYLGGLGRKPLSFLSLVDFAVFCVRPEDQPHVSESDLRTCIGILVDVGVVAKHDVVQQNGSTRTRYQPNWGHPFCADATSDIPSCDEGKAWRSVLHALNRARGVTTKTAAPNDLPASQRTRDRRELRRRKRTRAGDRRPPLPPPVV